MSPHAELSGNLIRADAVPSIDKLRDFRPRPDRCAKAAEFSSQWHARVRDEWIPSTRPGTPGSYCPYDEIAGAFCTCKAAGDSQSPFGFRASESARAIDRRVVVPDAIKNPASLRYAEAHWRLGELYVQTQAWARKVILNIAASGRFSSDRTIAEYAKEIWHIAAVPLDQYVLALVPWSRITAAGC